MKSLLQSNASIKKHTRFGAVVYQTRSERNHIGKESCQGENLQRLSSLSSTCKVI